MTPSKTQRIVFPDGVDLSEVASSDEARYVLSFIHVKKGIARATDGRCLVLAEVTNETESPEALIPKRAIKIAAKKKSKSAKALGNTVEISDDKVRIPTAIDEAIEISNRGTHRIKFPSVKQVFPVEDAVFAIRLNVDHLVKVSKALGSKDLTLARTDQGATFPTVIFSEGHPDRIALLMPLSGSAMQNPLWAKIKKGALNDD